MGDYPTNDQWSSLEAFGIEKLEYLPKRCFLVRISKNADIELLSDFGAIWSMPFRQEFKSDMNIMSAPARAKVDGRVIINVHPFSNLSPKSIWAQIGNLEAELLEIEESLGYLTISTNPEDFEKITAQPFVKWVDWKYDAGVPENYTGRTSHRVNYISGDNTNGIDYDGSGINVALQDDGSIGPHIDHEGRIVEQFWQTSLGDHGDHVGGND